MNDATDWLELVRPDRHDPAAQPTALQAAALAADPALRAELARRTFFDEAAAAAVQLVPIPAGMVARLAALEGKTTRRKLVRRRAFAAAGMLALIGAALWLQFGPERSWTPERVSQATLAYHLGTATFAADDLKTAGAWLPARFDAAFLVAGGWGTVLGRDAYILRLRRGEHTATLAVLSVRVFPTRFDFDAQVSGDAETIFVQTDGAVCVAVAQDLRRFERADALLL